MDGFTFVQKGMDSEKSGDISSAIKYYEMAVASMFDGNRPYDRLAIIYHKSKRYKDEERVLRIAIEVFSKIVHKDRPDRIPKLQKFQQRLDKLTPLL